MKIYFSGSIRGGRQDAKLYKQLIEEIKNYGDVLTEHVGSSDISHELSDSKIHEQDMKWLNEADILIGEVTTPSHGVGYEIGRAVALDKKVFCLYRRQNNKSVSAMINGSPSINCYKYSTVKEAQSLIKQIFNGC
ncbi:nucleoside 2-deoxyribosyltransferase [Fodinibius sp. Rm-B-1B1-1]|uniref:nucleoside 2-deoxyribosyltransferase n=1 Tax=Fodinibius alkaliphilus TaxID=3140241 RepID=UPI00315A6B72